MAEECTKHGDNPIYHPVPTIQPGPEIGRNLCRVKGRCEGKYGGYRADILTENLNERDKVGFICTICEGIMNEACISSSGEQFCSCCRNIYSHIKETSNVPVRKMINTLKCCCPSIERGCEWLGTLKDCENHLDTCGYVYVSCKLKCGVVLRRDKLEKHANECSHRQVKCDHCKKDFKSGELNRHLNKCPEMKVSCDLCNTQITREDMPQHLEHDCGMVQEACILGCGVKITRNGLKAHVKYTCVQRKITCEHCDISIKFCDNPRHLRECPKVKVPCDLCGTQITRENMPQHLKHDCAMVQETCQLGCGAKLTRNELKIHVKDTCVQRKITCEHCDISLKFCDYCRHLEECPKVKVQCDLCDTQITREDMPQHLKHDCGMVQEICQLGCGAKLTRNERKIHEKDTCVQRKITCEHCDISVKFCDYPRHLKECPKVKMTCEQCREVKYRKDMTEHFKDYCPEKMLECPFVKYKCMTRIRRKDMDNHLEEKEIKHLGLKLTVMEDLISQQSEEFTKQNEEIIKQSEEIIKQSEEIKKLIENNEKQNIEMMMEKENTSQQFRLLCSITETTKIIWKIKDVTNLKKRLLESALYTVAGYRFRLQFLMDSLTIVFPETTSKYVKPFIAKCTIVLSTKQINCGMLEAKQKDLTRGCVRNITSISQEDIDEYSQPISPESLMKDLTLEIYLTMQ